VGQIPLTGSGNVKLQHLHQWIKVRKAIESQNDCTNLIAADSSDTGCIVECPGVTDVIVSVLGEKFRERVLLLSL
jgi:hypothetical protein